MVLINILLIFTSFLSLTILNSTALQITVKSLDEGDDIWSIMLEITHCPYCGEKLPGLEKIDNISYGKFSHIDSSGWSSKMM